ncbi:MAG: enoyl-ACP reductase, partial [Chloroflexi bacterium]|nr:enoyl-ACP reductase [Chloroflexota bacterium]
MGLLEGKNALIFGVANNRSIAWGITQAFQREGANIGLSYAGPALERRVRRLADEIGCTFVEPCDVTQDDQIEALVEKAKAHFGHIDILVHAVAYAEREDLARPYYQTSRQGFHTAMDVSVYSFTALARAFQPLMPKGGSMLTMTYYGGVKVVPHYNVMGVAKAALEASVRYLAYDLGKMGLRVNAISAGPIRTLSAAGIAGFRTLYKTILDLSPLKEDITIEDIGNAAVFLCSDMARRVTGEVLYVDAGYNVMGFPDPDAL